MANQKFYDASAQPGFDEIYNGNDEFIGTIYKRDDGLYSWFARSSNETGNAFGSFKDQYDAIYWLENLDAQKGM